ncbi:MAG TPA: SRPBCC family protein [Gaiellaceae bacterium]
MKRSLRARASAVVQAPPDAVFAFLSDLRNHWRLASRNVRIVELDGDASSGGGRVVLHGPLGISRVAQTRITQAVAPTKSVGGVVEGTAATPHGTSLRVAWNVSALPAGTQVVLELTVERARMLDRLLLVAGGRRWLERRLLGRAVADLADTVSSQRR